MSETKYGEAERIVREYVYGRDPAKAHLTKREYKLILRITEALISREPTPQEG